MKKYWILLFLSKSISQRKGQVFVASLAVTLAVAVITGMIGITAGINEKLGSELKAYGANIIVSDAEDGDLAYDGIAQIAEMENVVDAEGQLFGSVMVKGNLVDFIGVDMKHLKEKGWRYTGRWPAANNEILAGVNLKRALELEEGTAVFLSPSENDSENISKDDSHIDFIVSGFVERGASEDNVFLIPIRRAWELSGSENSLSAILIRCNPNHIDAVIENIKTIFPSVEIKTLGQVAYAEKSLLNKIQLLMALVTIVVLLAAVISVGSTMGANVLERREEIGLMMALGATRNGISLIYALEAALIGLLGGIAGFVLGYISIQAISRGALGSYISTPFILVFLSLITGLLIALISSHLPIRDALKYSPAEILRGG